MNDQNFDQLLDAWMDLGPHVAPARVTEAVRFEARSTRQMPPALSWWATRRFPSMNNYLRIGAAAAVVAIAAALGYGYVIAPNVGGPGGGTPASTETPTVAPGAALFDAQPAATPLEPGSYYTTVAGHRITFTVPAGWQPNAVPQVLWTGDSEARLGFGEIEQIYADPCQPNLGVLDPPPGPTADDLAVTLAAIPGVTATTTDAEVSGFSARFVEVEVPGAFGTCNPNGGLALLNDDIPFEPAIHRFWLVDVGGNRVVIQSVARPEALSRQVDELDEIVASIQIETP